MIKLYELVANEEGVSPSPFVNIAELFLKHNGLEYKKIPLTFAQVNGKWSKVPTLIFSNGDIIFDTPKIAQYLDQNYPSNPDEKLGVIINNYDSISFPKSYQDILLDAYKLFDKDSAKYFKQIREQILNLPWEKIPGDRQNNTEIYYKEIMPINEHLTKSKFIDGDNLHFMITL